MIVLVMGVSGAGKTTIGHLLARELGARFIDGDDYHSPENLSKMRSGVPLNDLDRKEWLDDLASVMADSHRRRESVVVACSALKVIYRNRLLAGCPARILWLNGSRELVTSRLAQRRNHFMPPELLSSQFEILEAPDNAIALDIGLDPQAIVREAVQRLRGSGVEKQN